MDLHRWRRRAGLGFTISLLAACATSGGGGSAKDDAATSQLDAELLPDAPALLPDAMVDAAPDAQDPDTGPPPNPVPVLTSVTPSSVVVGSVGPTLVVAGDMFTRRSGIQVNGTDLPTTYISVNELRATLPT